MRKKLTPLMKQVARNIGLREDAPITSFRRMLARVISNHGNLEDAARALEIDVTTLSRWCSKKSLNIELRTTRTTIAHTIAVLPEQEAEREGEEEPIESVEA